MMTKAMILRYLEEIAGKLAELRVEVERLPETIPEALTEEESTPSLFEQDRAASGWFVDKHELQSLVARAFEEMGIYGEPLGAEAVQEMIRTCGVIPEEKIFSQGGMEMRGE